MCKETIWKCPDCLYTRHDSWTTCAFGRRAAASAEARGAGAPGPFACPNYFRGHEWCAETRALDACPNARYHCDFAPPAPAPAADTAAATTTPTDGAPTMIDEEKAGCNGKASFTLASDSPSPTST